MIPKGAFVTLCILGRAVNVNTVDEFLELDAVRRALPCLADRQIACRCLPKMNVRAPRTAYADRMVMCGDAGSTRLFKDGLGAAYLMGKAAAKTAIFQGIGEQQFARGYYPVYKRIMRDNRYGSLLYALIGLYRKYGLLTKAMLQVVEKEQGDRRSEKIMSSILWDMFTGNEKYHTVFSKSLKVRMHLDLWEGLLKSMFRR
jgi:hypothetical protein